MEEPRLRVHGRRRTLRNIDDLDIQRLRHQLFLVATNAASFSHKGIKGIWVPFRISQVHLRQWRYRRGEG